ncbi:MAG TPA: type II and III secretion system protein family protein [Acidobacteriaceae bacterium]|nr:type II and III secretion system protein family protein [Acidobacteriaceae bacterium]
MAIRQSKIREGTCRAIAPLVLCSLMQAQTATTPPAGAATPSLADLHIAKLPDPTAELASSMTSPSQSLHVWVGQSIFISTVSRLKRVYVSDPQVVDSFTSSPRQIVVTAKMPGVSSVILWDEAGNSATYWVSSDLNVVSLQKEIHQALPSDNISVEAHQDRISLSGTVWSEASAEVAVKLAGLYAKNVVNSVTVRQLHTRQVKLKVQIIEIDRSKLEQFGINLFSQGKNLGNSSTGQFPSTQTYTPANGTAPATLTTSNPLNLFFYNFGVNVGLTIQDLQDRQIAQILAEPTITTLSGQKASFLAGGEFPFPVVQGSSGGLTSITIQFRPYGVKLEFTPTVNDDETILLKVAPEVSALDYTNAVTISGYTIPAISTRRADTQVELRNGQSFAISGLLDHRTTDIFNKMPGIGDVPILGQLFKSKNVNHSTVELMVVVTPVLVDPLSDTTVPTLPHLPVGNIDSKQFDSKIGEKKSSAQPQPGGGATQ